MSEIKKRIEKFFEQTAHVLYQNRLKVLFVMLSSISLLVWQIQYLTVDTSSEAMLHKDDPKRLAYNDFRDQFGNSNIILLCIKSPDIFNPDFLKKLKSFHEEIENKIPYLREVTSLINSRNTYGKDDVLYVNELLKDWPEKKYDLSEVKNIALNNHFYKNNILSHDSRLTAIVIELEAFVTEATDEDDALAGFDEDTVTDEKVTEKKYYLAAKETDEIVKAIEKLVSRYKSDDFTIALTGQPIVLGIFNRITKQNTVYFVMLTTIIAIIFLGFLFRRISGMILPIIIVQLALFSTMGLMSLLNLPMTLFSTIIPTFLVAVGIADSVHILAIFYRSFQQGNSKEDAIAYAMGHSGLAILMTSLTTVAGLMSFSFSELLSLAELGVIVAIGVVLALIYTVIMLPALISLIPIKKKLEKKSDVNGVSGVKSSNSMDRVLLAFANFSTSHPVKIIALSFVLFIVSILSVLNLNFSHSLLKYFPDSMQIKHDVVLVDREFKGALVIEAVIDTKKENGIYDPEIINRIEKITTSIPELNTDEIFAEKIISINDILKETNRALHGNSKAYYKVPQDRKTIAQELLLFENSGSDDLEKIADTQFSKTRISIRIPWVDLVIVDEYLTAIESKFNSVFQNKAEVTITGITALMGRTIPAAIRSMGKSYIIAFIVITFLMLLLLGNVKFGLISMIPNLLPILIVMAFMSAIGTPLDMTSLMIGSIAIGLVVDDTMHFMYNFTKYYDITGNTQKAVRETLLGTGRAIMITSLVLCSNFFALLTGTLKSTITFGFFTGLVIIIALVADLVLAPALMTIATRKKNPVKASEIAEEVA